MSKEVPHVALMDLTIQKSTRSFCVDTLLNLINSIFYTVSGVYQRGKLEGAQETDLRNWSVLCLWNEINIVFGRFQIQTSKWEVQALVRKYQIDGSWRASLFPSIMPRRNLELAFLKHPFHLLGRMQCKIQTFCSADWRHEEYDHGNEVFVLRPLQTWSQLRASNSLH